MIVIRELLSATRSTRLEKSLQACFVPGRLAHLVSFLCLLVSLQSLQAADALKFFKNYMVTGDYVVGGVGLRGKGIQNTAVQSTTGGVSTYATDVIHISGVPGYVANSVPQHADIVAAYLYWETIANPQTDPSLLGKGAFRGLKIAGTLISAAGTQACWSSGGGNGNQSGAQSLLVYRADVLRYLPYKKDTLTGKPLGQRLVNDSDLTAAGFPLHTVSLPDSGAGGTQSASSGNQAFLTEGASLVVVYRVAGARLKSVVIYDGGYTFSSINPQMTQTIQGFYEATTKRADINAKMTHIVGDGDTNFKENLTVKGSVPAGVSATNAFQGAQGTAWDNLTFDVANLMSGDDASINTSVTPSGPASTDCLSWSAIIFSTTVQDTDGDGLLDIWETSGFSDISDGSFVNLPAMSANPNVRDLFVEIDFFCSATSGVCNGQHTHLPTRAAIDQAGDAFLAAGIHLHVDVGGDTYQGDSYVISKAAGTAGGEAIPETLCGATDPVCAFFSTAGTVSWKNGYQLIKNGGTSGGNLQAGHFAHNRKDIFHYALFTHALGLPKWRTNDKSLTSITVSGGVATAITQLPHGLNDGATIAVLGAPSASNLNGTYQNISVVNDTTFQFATTAADNAYLNWSLAVSNGTPRSNSGVSDIGGGDLMITLGLWDNSTGTDFMQASTFFHELGHNLDLGHGGDISDPANCKPNYLSSMSYLFQARGLLDVKGIPHINYSGVALPTLNEGSLNESPSGLGNSVLPYLPRWYAPLSSSFLDNTVGTSPATKHCDGTPVTDGAQMVRVDGISLVASPIDWNGDGSTSGLGLSQDINFNGTITAPASPGFQGFNDWASVNLQQVGARRSASASSVDVMPGQDLGDDLGLAGGDLGLAGGDLGLAGGDLGLAGGDLGLAGGDLGLAGGDLGLAGGDLGGELDFEGARSLGNAPNALVATAVGFNIDLSWTPPNVDISDITTYRVWRATCPKGATIASPCRLSPALQPAPIGFWTPGSALCDGSYNFCDSSAKNNTVYLYFVTAAFNAPQGTQQQSGPSNIVAQSR